MVDWEARERVGKQANQGATSNAHQFSNLSLIYLHT
jgi:hypothetical protein